MSFRLALILNSLPPRTLGGAELQGAETAKRLARRGHDVTVFGRALAGETPGLVESDGVRWIRTPVTPVPGLSFLSHLIRFGQDWRRYGNDPHAVIAYQLVINGVLGTRVTGNTRPLITWVRSEVEVQLSTIRKYRWLSPPVLRRSRAVIVQSSRIWDVLARELGAVGRGRDVEPLAGRVSTLGNAIETQHLDPESPREGMVFLGRLVEYKGVEIIFEALRRMEHPPPLRIYGDGPLRAEWERLSEGLPVRFEGRILPGDIPRALGTARIMLAPSWTEGFPNAILEGMERGLPVVATPVGAVPDLVRDGENGYLIPPGDAAALADRIHRLMTDEPLWHRLSQAARATAETYGWEGHLDRLEALLGEVTAAP